MVIIAVLSKPTAAAGIIITQHFGIRLKANELPKRHLNVKLNHLSHKLLKNCRD